MTMEAAEFSVKNKKTTAILEGTNRHPNPEACSVKI